MKSVHYKPNIITFATSIPVRFAPAAAGGVQMNFRDNCFESDDLTVTNDEDRDIRKSGTWSIDNNTKLLHCCILPCSLNHLCWSFQFSIHKEFHFGFGAGQRPESKGKIVFTLVPMVGLKFEAESNKLPLWWIYGIKDAAATSNQLLIWRLGSECGPWYPCLTRLGLVVFSNFDIHVHWY